jgi:hypothetical protein
MTAEAETNDQAVVIPERSHDQPAEGGREQAEDASGSTSADAERGSAVPDPEAAGIVDQQGAALRQQQTDPDTKVE